MKNPLTRHPVHYKRRVFKTFFLSYVSILLLVVITGALLMQLVMRMTLENEQEKNRAMLKQAALTIDGNLMNIDSYMSSVLFSDSLKEASQMQSPYRNSSAIIKSMNLKNFLSTLYLSSFLCQDVVIYLSRPNVLFTSSGHSFFTVQDYFKGFVSVEGSDAAASSAVFTARYRAPFLAEMNLVFGPYSSFGTGSKRCMLYVRPIIINGSNLGNMVGILPQTGFERILLTSAFDDVQDIVWLESKEGDILLSLPDYFTARPDDSNMLECVTSSDSYGIVYHMLAPRSAIRDAFFRVACTVLILVAAVLLVGLLISLILATYLGKPLDNVSANLRVLFGATRTDANRSFGGGLKEMRFIDRSVQNLLRDQELASEYLNVKTGIVQQFFYEKLLMGYFLSEEQILQTLKDIWEPVYRLPIRLVVCRLFTEEDEITLSESGYAKSALDTLFADMHTSQHKLLDVNMEICVILCEDTGDTHPFTEVAQAMSERLREMPSISCSLLVSWPIERYYDIGTVYSQCLDQTRRPLGEDTCEIRFASGTDSSAGPGPSDYTLDSEGRLVNFVLTGSKKNVQEMLTLILGEEHDDKHSISLSERMLFGQLMATLMRLEGRFRGEENETFFADLPAAVHRLGLIRSRREAHDIIRSGYDAVCGMAQASHGAKVQVHMQQVQTYIDEHYADASLTLKSLSDAFHLSEAYLSRAFKACTGINPMSYVEKRRIEHAIPLLSANSTLESIASSVGFDNADRFRNAFKRITGKLPSQYREELISEALKK